VSIENREVLPQRARIMHHQSQLADLVDVLAVDFDIVDTTGLRREARGWRKPLIRKATQQSLGPRLRVAQLAAPIPGDRRAVVGK
jgi:hypothetical protein